MTQSEKRIKLARFDGWTFQHGVNVSEAGRCSDDHGSLLHVPNYFSDSAPRYVVDRLERKLTDNQWIDYIIHLGKLIGAGRESLLWKSTKLFITATAAQRCHCIGIAAGLWNEGD